MVENLPRIQINNTTIKEVNKIKFLGVIFDKKLSFESHVDYLCKKQSCCVGSLNHIKHFIPKELTLNLY